MLNRVMRGPTPYSVVARRRIRVFGLGIFFFVLSMAISYYTVQHLAERMSSGASSLEERVAAGTALRRDANELVALMTAYLSRIPLEETAPRPSAYQWAQEEFRVSLEQYRMRIAQEGAAFQEGTQRLLDAANVCVSMTDMPWDVSTRGEALERVREAVDFAEARIDGLDVGPYLLEVRARLPRP